MSTVKSVLEFVGTGFTILLIFSLSDLTAGLISKVPIVGYLPKVLDRNPSLCFVAFLYLIIAACWAKAYYA